MSMRRTILSVPILSLVGFLSGTAWAATPDEQACLQRQGPDALAACGRWVNATRTAEERAQALFGRAVAQEDAARLDAALADLDAALRLDPRRADIFNTRGNLWLKRNDVDRAIADFDAALKLNPNLTAAYINRANMRERRNEFAPALSDLDQALRLAPNFVPAINGKAWTLFRAGRFAEALPFADRAIELEPSAGYAYDTRAQIREALGQDDLALQDIRRAVALTPGEPDIRQSAARIEAKVAARDKAVSTAGERRVALVIGNSAYESVSKLKNTENDARAIAERLRTLGFQEVQLAINLRRDAMNSALGTFARAAEGADWAVIYYAGHGIEIDRVNWLVPIDASLKSDREVRFQAISLDQALAAVEGAKKMRVVVLDACRDNPFLAQITRSGTVTRSVTRGLGGVEPRGGTQVLFAAKDGEVALDGDGQNSPFVLALLKHIGTPGLEIGQLFRKVTAEVLRQTDNKQQPYVYGTLPEESFFFRR